MCTIRILVILVLYLLTTTAAHPAIKSKPNPLGFRCTLPDELSTDQYHQPCAYHLSTTTTYYNHPLLTYYHKLISTTLDSDALFPPSTQLACFNDPYPISTLHMHYTCLSTLPSFVYPYNSAGEEIKQAVFDLYNSRPACQACAVIPYDWPVNNDSTKGGVMVYANDYAPRNCWGRMMGYKPGWGKQGRLCVGVVEMQDEKRRRECEKKGVEMVDCVLTGGGGRIGSRMSEGRFDESDGDEI